MKNVIIVPLIILIAVAASAASSDELNYNLVNLFGAAESHVDNDLLAVTMQSSADAASAQEAANMVNQEMNWALNLIKDIAVIKKQTINYQTRARYQNKVIIGWSVSQQLRLESEDIDTLSHFIGSLQEKLQVISMDFKISPSQKKDATEALITEALAAFEEKARLVSLALRARDFRIVTLNIAENAPAIPLQRGYQMEAMSLASADPPQLEAGESTLAVRVDGTIQLIF